MVVALTLDEAADRLEVAFTVQIINEYCVAAARPVMDLDVAFAAAVVVVPRLQLAGALAPD
jgi:hypothetical protein